MRKGFPHIAAAAVSCLLVALICMGANVAAQVSPIERLVGMEQVLFGSIQEGAVVNRLEIIERLVFGKAGTGTLPDRMEQCWSFVQGDRAGGMNLKFKLKAVQWSVFGSIVDKPIVPALDDAETRILGATGAGSIGQRLDVLIALTIPGGKPNVDYSLLPKGALVKLAIESGLSSSKSRPGDVVRLIVLEDVAVDGRLVIPKGTVVAGRVLDNVRPTKTGVKARVDVEISTIEGMDSAPITLGVDTAAIAANTAATVAASESPRRFAAIGKDGGFLSPNPELELEPGTPLFLSVMQSAKVLGLTLPAAATK